jgi:pantothenate kinase type III
VGFAGAVRALAEAVAAEAGLAGAPVVLTGGAACFLERAGLFGDRRVVYDEHLVGRGLRAAMALAKGAEL